MLAVAAPVAAQGWLQRATAGAPPARNSSPAAYDVYRGVTVLFGGFDGTSTPRSDTWEWNGTVWNPRVTLVKPAGRSGHGLAFDSQRGKVVLFGGYDGSVMRNDTWEWDGASWQQRIVATPPPARGFAGMAYDGARGVTVLFGGEGAAGVLLADTWEWDGTSWMQRGTAAAPSARRGVAMAWDEVRRQALLFGGSDGSQALGDTWWWSGGGWQQAMTLPAPAARQSASMAFDGNCGRVVLHGGANQSFANSFGDAWEWNGMAWSQASGSTPSARHGASMAHDAQRGQFVVFGGRDVSSFLADTWELAPSCVRAMATVAPPAVGQTAQFRYSYPGAAAAQNYCWTLLTPRQPAAFSVPIPGIPTIGLCRVDLFNILSDQAVLLDGSGSLLTAVPIPFDPALTGYPFDVQSVDMNLGSLALRWAENDSEVTTAPAPPVASFSATPTSGSSPLTVAFTNNSTQATSYAWIFGDGTSSTVANPPPKVFLGGTYNVSLTVTGPGGTATAQQQIVVSGGNAAPVASFTAAPTSGSAPLTVQFTDTSSQSPIWWLWDFENDGIFDSTQQNPSWTYTNNGVFSVRMVAVNYLGGGTVTQTNLVIVGATQPSPSLNMQPIAPGAFQMGSSNFSAQYPQEAPVHLVTLTNAFWIGKYEVTQAQYQAIMGTNPSYFQGASVPKAPQRPVERVTWNDAVAFCQALTTAEQAAGRVPVGYQYRLPTEAEWEYCCRAGTVTDWNTGPLLTTSQANFQGALTAPPYPGGQTAVVGSYLPNAFGLYEMHGNLWEWCLDTYVSYTAAAVTNPFTAGGSIKAIRGGSWNSLSATVCRSAVRDGGGLGASYFSVGFRVVLAPVLVP